MRPLAGLAFVAGILVIGLALPAGLAAQGWVSWPWLRDGAIAWAVAVLIKMAGSFPLQLQLYNWKVSLRGRAAVSGVWSALCELGAIAYLCWTAATYPGWPEALSLGVGAGAFEALILGAVGVAGMLRPDETPDPAPWRSVGMSLLERILALAGHVASRGLVWIGLMSWAHAPWLIPAMVFFALVDGVAAYGSEAGWDWSSPRVQGRFYGFLAIVGLLEGGILALAGRDFWF